MRDGVFKRLGAAPVARIGGAKTFDESRCVGGAPTPQKGAFVEFDCDAVQFDRFVDCSGRQRDHAALIGITQNEHIGCDRVAQQMRRETGRFLGFNATITGRRRDSIKYGGCRKLQIRLFNEISGDLLIGIEKNSRSLRCNHRECRVACRRDVIAADDEICRTLVQANGIDVAVSPAEANMADYGPALSRDSSLISGPAPAGRSTSLSAQLQRPFWELRRGH